MNTLQQLHVELEALGEALADDALDDAARIMSGYDARLRDYVEHSDAGISAKDMDGLLRSQNALVVRMRERQQALGDAMRLLRRADTASRAYANAGAAP